MDCSSHSDSYYNGNNNSHQSSSSSTPTPPAKQPLHKLNKSTSNVETQNELLQLAAIELESFRRPTSSTKSNSSSSSISSPQRKVRKQNSSNSLNSTNSHSSNESADQIEETERAFPQACLHLLHTLSGNTKCHDCLAPSPSWASVSYGITLCLQCSGKHRSLGVNVSYVKSLTLDSWKRTEILCMLEGGNGQLDTFFSRHEMGSPQIAASTRKTLDSPSNSSSSSTPRGSPTTKNTVGVLDRYKTKAASFYRQHLKSHAKTIASKDGLYEGRDAHRNKKKSSSSSKSKRRGDKSSSSSSTGGGGSKGKTKLLGEKMKKGNEVVQQILESVTEVDIDSSCGSTRSAGFMD